MALPLTIFSFLSITFILYLLLFFFSSLNEDENRAAIFSFIVAVVYCSFFIGLYLLQSTTFYWFLNSLILAVLVLLLIPFKKNNLHQSRCNSRYDERDIMFARARYEPNSLAYEDYYTRRPEKKQIDDALRAMPNLLEKGGRFYEPVKAKIAETYFDLIEELVPLVDGDPTETKVHIEPDKISSQLKQIAKELGAVDAGIAELLPHHIYSFTGRGPDGYGKQINLAHPYIFVFAVEMDYKTMSKAPKVDVVLESSKKYLECAKTSIAISSFIRSLGYQARAHMDMNYQVILPAAAVDAGLGEMGRLDLLMHPKYGPRIRLGAVSTDLPLIVDKPQYFNGKKFCQVCKKCATNCPSGAISFGETKENRGVKKWTTNQEACYKLWREVGSDCGICMAVCPYSKPNSFVHNVVRFFARNSVLSHKAIVWADNFFYGRKPNRINRNVQF